MTDKIRLYGFNNLTKSLSFNLYDVCYAKTIREQEEYLEYLDEQYNSDRLTAILVKVTDMIGAHVLNISKQDYEPRGASVNVLISEEKVDDDLLDKSNNRGRYYGSEAWQTESNPVKPFKKALNQRSRKLPRTKPEHEAFQQALKEKNKLVHCHLDKSHVTVHTFPESHPSSPISTFRVDIDVSTCGEVTPLNTLDYLISCFDSDIMSIDYKVRGFTRTEDGTKLFLDHHMRSIQDYIAADTLSKYDAFDLNMYQMNFFHTRLKIHHIELDNYLFDLEPGDLSAEKKSEIARALENEMAEIYSNRNLY